MPTVKIFIAVLFFFLIFCDVGPVQTQERTIEEQEVQITVVYKTSESLLIGPMEEWQPASIYLEPVGRTYQEIKKSLKCKGDIIAELKPDSIMDIVVPKHRVLVGVYKLKYIGPGVSIGSTYFQPFSTDSSSIWFLTGGPK